MDRFSAFINSFLKKQYQSRWHCLYQKGWPHVRKNLAQLDRQLNHRCQLFTHNGWQQQAKELATVKHDQGDWYNFTTGPQAVNLHNFSWDHATEGLLILHQAQLAFYLHHEGWIWICKNQDRLSGKLLSWPTETEDFR